MNPAQTTLSQFFNASPLDRDFGLQFSAFLSENYPQLTLSARGTDLLIGNRFDVSVSAIAFHNPADTGRLTLQDIDLMAQAMSRSLDQLAMAYEYQQEMIAEKLELLRAGKAPNPADLQKELSNIMCCQIDLAAYLGENGQGKHALFH